MSSKILKDFFIGFIRIHILYHASREPVYGSELMMELSRHGYTVGPGTLYPVLHRMEEDGLMESQTQIVNGKRRRYYTITNSGLEILDKAKKQANELIAEINEDNE